MGTRTVKGVWLDGPLMHRACLKPSATLVALVVAQEVSAVCNRALAT